MSIPESDRLTYLKLLREIRTRIDLSASLLKRANAERPMGGAITVVGEMNIEAAALHLRKALELIAFGSLVTNRQAVALIAAAFQRKDADKARNLARKANPSYWPHALENQQVSVQQGETRELKPLKDGYLREEEWGRAFGEASELLHSRNPYLPRDDMEARLQALGAWVRKVVSLLNHHKVTLLDRDYILVCVMSGIEIGGDVQVAVMERLK